MNQFLVILALIAIGYVLYRSVVIKRRPNSNQPSPTESQLNNVRPTTTTQQTPPPEVETVEPEIAQPTTTVEPSAVETVGTEAELEAQHAVTKAAEKAHMEHAEQATKSNLQKQMGSSHPSDAAAQAPESVHNQANALKETNDALARHRLYQQIVEQCYRERSDDSAKAALTYYASAHIREFDEIKEPLKKQNGGKLPQVATFKQYASALAEQGQYEEAIAICRKALDYGLKDGTKSGYQGRIERIEAKLPKN